MKKSFKLTAAVLVFSIAMTGHAATGTKVSANAQETKMVQSRTFALEQAQKDYLEHVDVDYSYNIAKKMEAFKSNQVLGYRTAGSEAEFKTGEMLYNEMKQIGLQGVSKDEITLDTWTFEKAKLSFKDAAGKVHNFELGGYPAQFDTKGKKQYEIVYAGKGTAADLEGLDIKDKLVLVDINQRDEWWINYPAYQAHLKGAAAIIAMQDGGYAEVSDEALNTQDMCGPADAPAFSISRSDAKILKEALKASGTGSITVDLDAKSEVGFDGKSYNIVGTIPGKDPESMILVSAHYDSYYSGFQDDNTAIGLMMGIAKGLKDSGYKPEKTIIFCAMAAEEWGVSNTRYDWSTGAYNEIFRVHPEWVGKIVANINFELPSYAHGEKDDLRSVYEYKNFLTEFVNKVPNGEGAYKDGINILTPVQTWSDDFSMAIAGVPSMRNDFSGTFMEQRYHSQFDNDTTYNKEAYLFHHNLYGMLVLEYDRVACAPLDFTTRLEALKSSLDKDTLNAYGISDKNLEKAIDEAVLTTKQAYSKVEKINKAYAEALEAGETEKAAKLYQEAKEFNKALLDSFKFAEDQFVRLTWEDVSIFPHENAQNNLINLKTAIEALEKGNVQGALDENLLLIDNNWYAYDFDQDVFNYFSDYVLNQPAERLMWGAGRVTGHVDLFDTIKSLLVKSKEEKPELTTEIKTLKAAQDSEKEAIKKAINQEEKDVKALNEMLKKLI